MKLVQKQLFKGSRSFEINGDTLNVQIKTGFRTENSSVILAVVNPEPVVNEPLLEFLSRVNSEPLFSLWLGKPDAHSFNQFVDQLKRCVREEYGAFTGLRSGTIPEGLAANSYEEPPDFDTPKQPTGTAKPISVAGIDSSIRMLREHLDGEDLEGLLQTLEALKTDPESPGRYTELVNVFESLGPRQGAVLTYAPYISILLSDDPFEF